MTREQAEKIEGRCRNCGEMTNLAESCCGAPVYFEGHWYSPDEVEEE